MFKVIEDKIYFGDCIVKIPDELSGKQYTKVFGTATCGLEENIGFIRYLNGKSAEVQLINRMQAGIVIDDAQVGDKVYLREQLDPETTQSFYLISKQKINNQLNWINVQYKDGLLLRICPFTFRYKIIDINIFMENIN